MVQVELTNPLVSEQRAMDLQQIYISEIVPLYDNEASIRHQDIPANVRND